MSPTATNPPGTTRCRCICPNGCDCGCTCPAVIELRAEQAARRAANGGPIRIERKRIPGWRKPDNCVIVTRPSRFGNPFTVAGAIDNGYAETPEQARAICTTVFRSWLRGNRDWWMGPKADATRERILDSLPDLRGRDLACWCPLPAEGQPDHCHAQVLLELANAPKENPPA
ncbi:hypothetical protein SANTM175S_07205 [Streptomyces antimycoticus]